MILFFDKVIKLGIEQAGSGKKILEGENKTPSD